jgi:hypothetical protein
MGQKYLRTKIIPMLLLIAISMASAAAPPQQPYPFNLPNIQKRLPTIPKTGKQTNILDASYLKLRSLHPTKGIYGLEELAVDLDASLTNPFDPEQINLQVQFTSPAGEKITVAAFWYQDFYPQTLQPRGNPEFRVRFTPTLAGEWTAQAFLKGANLKSKPLNFKVLPNPQSHGFVRLNQDNPNYLSYDDGKLYFPIGLNMAWSRGDVLVDYRHWMDQLSRNGGNTIRVWMASWSFGLEWNDTGLGDYSNRLRQAWLLDQVFDMAQARGIYIMLTLINHGAFSLQADSEWQQNPYNAALGGPCQNPEDFASDPLAREYFKRRLRYITSRWAYSPNLMTWEWWNEVDWTPLNDVQLLPWLYEMDAFLRTVDPYHHLITNSYKRGDRSNLWSMPSLDFAQVHDYSGEDPVNHLPSLYARLKNHSGEKPVLVGEYGNPSLQTDNILDRSGVHFHNGLWTAPFSGFSGTAMYWWWDQFIDPAGLWPQFNAIARFLKDEDLTRLKPGRGFINPDRATALTLSNRNRALIWIRNRNYNVAASRIAYSGALLFNRTGSDWEYQPEELTGLMLTIDGLQDGSYIAHWYSPQTATWLGETPIQVTSNTLKLPLPPLESDLALKILPVP